MTRKVVLIIGLLLISGCASTIQRDGAITLITDAKGFDAISRGYIGTIAETKAAGNSKSSFWETQPFWSDIVNNEEVK